MDPFTQVKSAVHMAKFNTKSISNRGTFYNFSLAPKRKIYKKSMKHLKRHKFRFQKRNCLGHRVQNVPENSAKTSLPWFHFKTDQRSVVKKTRLNSSKDDFLMKSFLSSTKRKLNILLNFLLLFYCLLTVYF